MRTTNMHGEHAKITVDIAGVTEEIKKSSNVLSPPMKVNAHVAKNNLHKILDK